MLKSLIMVVTVIYEFNCKVSPGQKKWASGRADHSSRGADIDELALNAGRVGYAGAAFQDNSVDDMDFCSELHDVENLLEVVDFDALSNGVLFEVSHSDTALLFADEGHQIVLLLEHLALILLLLMAVEHPYVHVLALRPLDALDEVVGGEFLEDFIEQIGREFGPKAKILLGARILLDNPVNPSIAVGEDGCEDAVDSILFTLHKRNIILINFKCCIINGTPSTWGP